MRKPTLAHLVFAVVLNLPFVLYHPAAPLLTEPLSRSLAINAVLFLIPGLPLAGILANRRPSLKPFLLFVIIGSFTVFVAVVIVFFLAHIPVSAGAIWNTTWALTNLFFILNIVLCGEATSIIGRLIRLHKVGVTLFFVAYITFYIGAVRIVPITGDNDDEMQFTVHGLLTSLEPSAFTPRDTTHYFAHPPLLHMCIAGSFLYYDRWADMAVFDSNLATSISSPREELGKRIEHYFKNPHRIETRTPNIFFGALTIACLGAFIAGSSAGLVITFLTAIAYMLTPEVFVRSSYGGYFAIGNLILMGIAFAEEERSLSPKYARFACFLTGALAAVADHKLVVVVASLALWEALRSKEPVKTRAISALKHPTVSGFATGTALFWLYGLTISAKSFWIDHVRFHLLDRIIHQPTPWQVPGHYPGVVALWLEFTRDTGWLLLPLALMAFLILLWKDRTSGMSDFGKEWQSTTGFWLLWTTFIALVFSVVDWRQTKHLCIMTLPLFLAPARAAEQSKVSRLLIVIVFALLIAWDLKTIAALSVDFQSVQKFPEW
jgi:hypothetical protein